MNDGGKSGGSSGAPAYTVRTTAGAPAARRTAQLYQALALLLVACTAGYLLVPAGTKSPTAAQPGVERTERLATPAERDATPGTAATGRITARPTSPATAKTGRLVSPSRNDAAPAEEPEGDTSLDLSDFVPPGEAPTAAQLIEELHKRGIHEGIGAFPPPGTSPPMVGLAVPEDFALPEGFVRHYQATDDGQRIEPILMFSPDYEFFDENGNPIQVPEDRVVPPGLAPLGMPLREIDIPPDRE